MLIVGKRAACAWAALDPVPPLPMRYVAGEAVPSAFGEIAPAEVVCFTAEHLPTALPVLLLRIGANSPWVPDPLFWAVWRDAGFVTLQATYLVPHLRVVWSAQHKVELPTQPDYLSAAAATASAIATLHDQGAASDASEADPGDMSHPERLGAHRIGADVPAAGPTGSDALDIGRLSRIDWSADAARIARLARAASAPDAGAWTWWRGVRVRVAGAEPEAGPDSGLSPGTVIAVDNGDLVVQTGRGLVRLTGITDVIGKVEPGAVTAGTVLGLDVADELVRLRQRVQDLEHVVARLADGVDLLSPGDEQAPVGPDAAS